MRLNRFLASAGLGSRRGVEAMITEGRVTLNNQTVNDLGRQVLPGDKVAVDGRPVNQLPATTIAFHKPRNYLCSKVSEGRFRSIYELLPPELHHLAHVGRLDAESEGLLLLTNDGDLAHQLLHPRHQLPKVYVATLDKPFDFSEAPRLLKGMLVEGKKAVFDKIHKAGPIQVEITLSQGIKRQIRVMLSYLGYDVRKLVRISIGELKLGTLKTGAWKTVRPDDAAKWLTPKPVKKVAPRKVKPAESQPDETSD